MLNCLVVLGDTQSDAEFSLSLTRKDWGIALKLLAARNVNTCFSVAIVLFA
jgi:hypothetical protein